MAGSLLFTAFLAIFANIRFVEGFINKDVQCRARKVLIPLDAPRYQYFPFYIEVFRCSGACSTHSPKTIQCAAVTWNNVSGSIYDVYAETLKAVTFQNHTSCGCECVTKAEDCSENERFVEDRCSCDCKYPDNPPTPCPERFSWNPFECKCVCRGPVRFCPPGQEWSHEACDCICNKFAVERCKYQKKYLNATTCECEAKAPPTKLGPGVTGGRSGEEMNWKRLLAVMVAELIVLVFLFDLYLFWRYEKGVIHWIMGKCYRACKATSNENTGSENENKGAPNGTTPRGEHGSPTITCMRRTESAV